MALQSGTKLGPFELIAPLGAGGMGEVYRALDTRLKREVAIKVLPDAFVGDRNRMARFQREAEVLASLSHPNIAAIYEIAESGNIRSLVMELVEGQTLAGPIPMETAIKYARQIAEALEYAHERGIVHRDLKPANIKITPEGTVKLLDFGLAKATEDPAVRTDVSNSPTFMTGATQSGMILGTAAYMSPEQARGTSIDKRADIWAFGVVFYEMLTGKALFTGEMTSDILVAVIKDEPDLTVLPERVRPLVMRCLKKDPKQRLRDIGDARIELDHPIAFDAVTANATRPVTSRWLWPTVAVASLLVAAVSLWLGSKPTSSEHQPVMHFTQTPPPGVEAGGIAMSSDGLRMAYLSGQGGRGRGNVIYVRNMENPEPKVVPGTEGARLPAFSPDGESLVFLAPQLGGGRGQQLKKTSLTTGTTLTLLPATPQSNPFVSWGEDGNILYIGSNNRLMRITSSGGNPEVIETGLNQGTLILNPQLLPGAKIVLFTMGGEDSATIAALDLKTHRTKTLIEAAGIARYVPSGADTGYIVYQSSADGSLLAAFFDVATLRVGRSVPVLSILGTNNFGISTNGTLAYRPGSFSPSTFSRGLGPGTTLVWINAEGKEQPIPAPSKAYSKLSLSPNGSRVALVEQVSRTSSQIVVYDFSVGSFTRISSNQDDNEFPVWSPDGKRLFYVHASGESNSLLSMSADGQGKPTILIDGGPLSVPLVVRDRTLIGMLVTRGRDPDRTMQLFRLSLGVPDAKPQPFLDPQLYIGSADISNDGKWLAYAAGKSSNESEVYIVPYPGSGERTTVSAEGGNYPHWSKTSSQLFYVKNRTMMAVDPFRPAKPFSLFPMRGRPTYDVARDGRFLATNDTISEPALVSGQSSDIHIILNWVEELKRKVPPLN